MDNKKTLAALSLLRKIIETFSGFFLSIYLFKLVNGDFNFLLLYSAFNAIVVCIFNYFLLKYISSKNANLIFRLSFACEIVSILMLLIMEGQILNIIWIFAALQRFAKNAYYVVYEITLIHSAKKHSLSSYVAGVQILSSIVTLLAPVAIGYLITSFSWHLVFVFLLVDAIVAAFIATKINFKVVHGKFHPIKYWKKISKNTTMHRAYWAFFLRRLSGTDGVLDYIMPVLLFLSLGTEFSVGSYDSLFSIVYIIMLEAVRILNKKGATKRFYIPLALLILASAIVMLANFNTFNVLLFYFALKTGGTLIMTESSSMIYAIGKQQKFAQYTKEHHFTWNIFLSLGNIAGVIITYIIYNYFYSKEAFAMVIVVLMIFFVIQAYILQKIEGQLQNS